MSLHCNQTSRDLLKRFLSIFVFITSERSYLPYDVRNRIQRFLCDSSICGEVLIHKNSSAPNGGPAPHGFALVFLCRTARRIRRTSGRNLLHENLIHISLNSTKIHMSRMEFLIVQSVFDESLLKSSVTLIRFRCRTFCIFEKEHKQRQIYAV